MSIERKTTVETDVTVVFDLDFDQDELVHVVPGILTVGDLSPEPLEGVGLEELVEEFLLQRVNQGDYTSLYCLAHEFTRFSEILGMKALQMEDSAFEMGRRYGVDTEAMIGDEI